jgi:tRNA pseudouridine55 synthase
VLLLDKPQGLTSNQALQRVKHLYQADKAGHTGSLDPLATGLLPICMGEASKFAHYLLEADKVYRTRIRLGERTATGDAEGELIETAPVPELTLAQIERVLGRFRGEIKQIPSMYSALKKNGRPLYELARKGIEIDRPARLVHIYRLELLQASVREWELEVHVSKGTYIRSLAEDIGAVLGCGAHVVMLRRLALGPFHSDSMISLDKLQEATPSQFEVLDSLLLPAWAGLANWPRVSLSELAAHYLLKGQPVRVPGAPVEGSLLIFRSDGQFLGIGEIDNEARIAPRRLIRA